MAQEIRLPDIGDFKDVPIIEILVSPGQAVRKEATLLTLESDKATLDVPAPEDGVIGEIHVKVGDKVSQGSLLATYASAGDQPRRRAAARRRASARGRSGRFRDRPARPRRWSRRLYGGVPRRRPRAEGGAGRPPAGARRRLPQRRLHSLEGAPPRRQDHRRGGGDGGARRQLRRAFDRTRRDPQMEGRRRQAPDDRPHRPLPPAQGDGGQRRGRVHLGQHRAGRDPRGEPRRALRQGDHRRRLRADRAGLHPQRSADLGLDRRARTALRPEAHARARRRDHRPRNGDRLSRARRGHHRHRNDGPADAGRRCRHRRAPWPSGSAGSTTRSC